jgi:hypothetical protein
MGSNRVTVTTAAEGSTIATLYELWLKRDRGRAAIAAAVLYGRSGR